MCVCETAEGPSSEVCPLRAARRGAAFDLLLVRESVRRYRARQLAAAASFGSVR